MATNAIKRGSDDAASSKLTKEALVLRAQMTHLWCKERLNFIHLFALALLGVGVWLMDHFWFFIVPFAPILAQIALGMTTIAIALYLLIWKR